MKVKDVLEEIMAEFGWEPGTPHYWSNGRQINFWKAHPGAELGYRGHTPGRWPKLAVFLPDAEPLLVRFNQYLINKGRAYRSGNGYNWPRAGIDFNLCDPDSIDKLVELVKKYDESVDEG